LNIRIYISLVKISILLSLKGVSQDQFDSLSMYKTAIDYVKNNRTELNTQWWSLFKKRQKKNNQIYGKVKMNFVISPRLCFRPILIFRDNISKLDSITHHTTEEINNHSLYESKYWFDSFVSDYIDSNVSPHDKCLKDSSNTLIITFSKPVNNYLIAEVCAEKERFDKCYVRIWGRSLWIIFIFSSKNLLKKVYFSYVDH